MLEILLHVEQPRFFICILWLIKKQTYSLNFKSFTSRVANLFKPVRFQQASVIRSDMEFNSSKAFFVPASSPGDALPVSARKCMRYLRYCILSCANRSFARDANCAFCEKWDIFTRSFAQQYLSKLKRATYWSLFPQCTTLLITRLVRSRAVWAEVFESEVVYT